MRLLRDVFLLSEMADCGHKTRRRGNITAYGQSCTVKKMPRNESGRFDFCLDCLAGMAIQCAWCGQAIFIGDPVTLYTPVEEFEVPDHAVVYSKDPLRLVGCLGWHCAITGGDRAGFLYPDIETGEGYVHRVPSPLELMLSSGKAIFIKDLSDPTEIPTLG